MTYRYPLTNEGINRGCEQIRSFLASAKIPNADRIKIPLLIEESLLQYQERFGDEIIFALNLYTILGTGQIDLRVSCGQFDPFSDAKDETLLMNEQILLPLLLQENSSESIRTAYSYANGVNRIRITAKAAKKRGNRLRIPGGVNTAAAVAAIVCGCLFAFVPEAISAFVLDSIVQPVSSAMLGVISAITIPLIFISVLSSICVMDNIASLNTIGLRSIGRFVMLTALITAVAMAAGELLFPVISINGSTDFAFSELLALLLQIIPKSLITPFVEGNALQIVFIALLVGACILLLDARVPGLKSFVGELNLLIAKMMEVVSAVIPFVIFLSIFQSFLKYSLKEILSVWRFVAAAYLCQLIVTIALCCYLRFRRNVKIANFVREIAPVLVVSLTTASSTLAIAPMLEVTKNKLKIEEKLCDFWVPIAHALFSPSLVPLLTTAGFFGAYYSGQTLSLLNLIVLFLLVIQLGIASPKVPGGVVAVLAILLTQLGQNTEAIGMIMLANTFIINVGTAFGTFVRCCEIRELSYRVKAQ